jgi:hypothetical protein
VVGALIESSGSPGSDSIRAELEAVLTSDGFARAPSLAQFLRYVCQKALTGEAEQIKEYNIAVEAFGRQPEFDQKEDAIVRVEAHRLRKRLKQYYEGDGANHAVHIHIPPGQYAPVFTFRNTASSPPASGAAEEFARPLPAAVAPLREVPPAAARVSGEHAEARISSRTWTILAAGAGVLLILGAIAATLSRDARSKATERAAATAATGVRRTSSLAATPASDDEGIRIACGLKAQKYVDSLGNIWLGDRYFQGGKEWFTPAESIVRTRDPALFQTRREGSEFRYDIPLERGTYELRLLFAERVFGSGNLAGGGETSRLFHVFVNGTPILENLDVISDAGGSNTLDEKVFTNIRPAEDGLLHLRFVTFKENAIVNGIVIMPAPPGKMRPFRMLGGSNSIRDSAGRLWNGDLYSQGGQVVVRTSNVAGTNYPEVYRTERYGNFNYAIPLAAGKYKLTLHFAENWFGPLNPGGGGEGSRVFDVHCNGVTLLRNFDIYKAAGGEGRAFQKSFSVTPNAQGKLLIAFIPVRNYASMSALEVEPQD